MRRILITGGFGKIGRHFIQQYCDSYHIRVADVKTEVDTFPSTVEVRETDLLDAHACMELCTDVDTVIHLAGLVDPDTKDDSLMETNMKTTQNILNAAVKNGCKRFIFASSAQTIEAYPEDQQINTNQLVKPKNLYGVAKCFGEALAAYHAHQSGISTICLRIGAYEFPADFTAMNARDLSAFLHPDDFNQLLHRCIETEGLKHEVLNAISDNRYKRLNITVTIERVGYQPQADAFQLFDLLEK